MLYTAETREAEKKGADREIGRIPEERPDRFDRLRPWYEDPGTPNLFDIHWGVREELAEAGITPKVGLNATSGEFEQTNSSAQLHTG